MNEDEYEKGHHSLIAAPGKLARTCVVCGTRTRYFCYGYSADAPTTVPQQLCIVVHPVEMGGVIALKTCTVSGNQTIKATHVYFIEGGEFLMQRMPSEGSEGGSGSRIQRNLNHVNLEAQRKVVNSTPTTRHKCVMLLYYTSNFNVC